MKRKSHTQIGFLICIGSFVFLNMCTVQNVYAQESEDTGFIILSGIILCDDTASGALTDVTVYNKQQNWGTTSDERGMFSIKMTRKDTIYFSTIQHVNQIYFEKDTGNFKDHSIEITMLQDTIWLGAVELIGYKNWEKFKSELLAMKIPDNDPGVTLPIISKYARQYATGEPALELTGPLTYLYNKYNRLARIKRKMQKYHD